MSHTVTIIGDWSLEIARRAANDTPNLSDGVMAYRLVQSAQAEWNDPSRTAIYPNVNIIEIEVEQADDARRIRDHITDYLPHSMAFLGKFGVPMDDNAVVQGSAYAELDQEEADALWEIYQQICESDLAKADKYAVAIALDTLLGEGDGEDEDEWGMSVGDNVLEVLDDAGCIIIEDGVIRMTTLGYSVIDAIMNKRNEEEK